MQYLKGGDLIRLQHTESKGYLASDSPFQMDDSEVFVRIYNGTDEFDEENYSVDTVWEIEINRPNNRGNTCKVKYRKDYQDHS